jgi:RNA polymerase sigma factor (sigma-70 family)
MRRTAADTLDDHRLVDAWQAGDNGAMGLLYERYAPALRAYCVHRLGNAADADDAVHDTFIKAQSGVVGFEPGAHVWPWLVTIAAHVCTDSLRRRARILELYSQPTAPRDLDEQVVARLRAAIVGDALRHLPPRYRVPLYLRHFVGSTYEDIARVQGRSVASVRSLLLRGRRHLGHRIEEVARSERQWPLPTTVPPLWQRIRLAARSCRDWAVRTEQALVAAFGPVSIVLNSLAVGAQPAAVGAVGVAVLLPVVAAAPGTAEGRAAGRSSAPTAGLFGPAPGTPSVVVLPGGPTSLSASEARYASIDTGPTYVPASGDRFGVHAQADIEDVGRHLRIQVQVVVTTPMTGPKMIRQSKHFDCADELREPWCTPLRGVLDDLPPTAAGT